MREQRSIGIVGIGQGLGSALSALGRGLGWRRVEELKLATGRNEECEDRLKGERSNG